MHARNLLGFNLNDNRFLKFSFMAEECKSASKLSSVVVSTVFQYPHTWGGGGGAVAQSVERATPGEEVPCSIPAVAARSPLVVSVSV